MISNYLKQSIQLIKANKVMSIISIAGTALSIAMIMVLVLIYQIQTANFAPEVNRDRTLYVEYLYYTFNGVDRKFGGAISERTAKECFLNLKSAKATVLTDLKDSYLSSQDELRQMKGYYRPVDTQYWNLFQYRFIEGRPFTQEEFQSGIKKTVISETVAKTVFGGSKEAMGGTVLVNFENYEVCGVVENVSSLLNFSYSDVWVPHTSIHWNNWEDSENTLGDFKILLLMNSPDGYAETKAEMEESFKRFNAGLVNGKIELQESLFDHLIYTIGRGLFGTVEMKDMMIRLSLVLMILLLVPAINLSSFTVSRMRNRLSEIGIRKAYGAVKSDIISQVLYENLMLTLIGGAIGVVISYLIINGVINILIGGNTFEDLSAQSFISIEMVFRPVVILYAFLFCLVLNLMSASIPAWRVSRTTIINAIKY